MIYDLIYHCKRGPTKVSFTFLESTFDLQMGKEILIQISKLDLAILSFGKNYLVLEEFKNKFKNLSAEAVSMNL